ncbi:hypothetical protein [Marinomonas balearica]|uniref:Uncharacterized protein n=1 Tax=Marinomonas balearica TaxID=491947 RepID=A0A4R6ME25_9GAMM|nr:hypothetical protein [Marinomonas balearica]TDO99824.1 hypothetical protein DFP79_0833 [Marinomonas balearica]
MKNIIFILSTIISPLAFSDVPNIFISGSPAKAAEVNQNFNALDSKITSANSRISALEDASEQADECESEDYWSANIQKISYEPKSSTIGLQLNYYSTNYRVVEVPFKEFGTGDLYKVRFPAEERSSDSIYAYLSTRHVSDFSECSSFNISSFPVSDNSLFVNRTFSIVNNGTTKSQSNLSASYSLGVKIGETYLSLSFNVSKTETDPVVSPGDYDFTDDFNTNNMTTDQALIDALDNLVDYVQITKVQ